VRARRSLAGIAALVCLGLAAILTLLAFDARGWQRTLTRDDLRFRALPAHVGLWRSPSLLPFDPAAALLGTADAVDYRRALQSFWFSKIGTNPQSELELPVLRAQTQGRLQSILDSGRTAEERSNAANLLGVLTVTTPSSDGETQTQTLQRAAEYFQRAILENPANYAAKLNLELVLRIQRPGQSKLGKDARGGYGFGRGKGAGVIGSGF
jgi:hypothetical protein